MLGAYFASLPAGTRPFSGIIAVSPLAQFRVILSLFCVENVGSYRTRDLRRGQARDMQARGATAREILEMGGWRSGAFMEYLDRDCLVDDAVLEAHLVESDEGEDSD